MPQPEILALLDAHALLVARGVRAAAMEALQDRYVEEARAIANRHDLFLLVEDLSEGWKEVWLYKQPHVGFIIEKTDGQPATAFEHWVLGKLFGYSEEAIADYLLRLGLLADLDEASSAALGARGQSVGAVV
jgi:hypothetical protein